MSSCWNSLSSLSRMFSCHGKINGLQMRSYSFNLASTWTEMWKKALDCQKRCSVLMHISEGLLCSLRRTVINKTFFFYLVSILFQLQVSSSVSKVRKTAHRQKRQILLSIFYRCLAELYLVDNELQMNWIYSLLLRPTVLMWTSLFENKESSSRTLILQQQ